MDLDFYKQRNIYYDKKELCLIWNFFVVIVMESQNYDKNVNVGIFLGGGGKAMYEKEQWDGWSSGTFLSVTICLELSFLLEYFTRNNLYVLWFNRFKSDDFYNFKVWFSLQIPWNGIDRLFLCSRKDLQGLMEFDADLSVLFYKKE